VILEEMLDRGVLPDLLPITSLPTASEAVLCTFVDQGAQRIQAQPLLPGKQFLILPIPAQFAQSPAAFDALLRSHLPPDDHAAHRWLRLSPRYLGTQARRLRTLACSPQTASKLLEILGPSAQQ